MADGPIQVLLIEDNPADARLISEILTAGRDSGFELETRDRLSAGLDRLRDGGVDVVLLDLSLPDSSGFDTFRRVHEQTDSVPILLLTGLDDQAFAVAAVHEGAQDFLNKDQVNEYVLTRAIRYAIERNKLVRDLQDALSKVKTLSGMIPICAWCRKVRNDKGFWDQVEAYIESRSNATFTHGICPDCAAKFQVGDKGKPK